MQNFNFEATYKVKCKCGLEWDNAPRIGGRHRTIEETFANPPLAASLDAWRPLWEKMDSNMLWEYSLELANLMTPEHAGLEHSLISFTMGDCAGNQDDTLCLEARFGHHFFRATPPMHLEAALRALGLVEQWEAGE